MNEIAVKLSKELGINADQAYLAVLEMVKIRSIVIFGGCLLFFLIGVFSYFVICRFRNDSGRLDLDDKMIIGIHSCVIGMIAIFAIKLILSALAAFIFPEQLLIYNLVDKLLN